MNIILRTVIQFIINAVTLFFLSKLLLGVLIGSYITALLVAFWLTLMGLLLRPFLTIIGIPQTFFTQAVFGLFGNAMIIKILDGQVISFFVNHYLDAFVMSLFLSFIHALFMSVFRLEELE